MNVSRRSLLGAAVVSAATSASLPAIASNVMIVPDKYDRLAAAINDYAACIKTHMFEIHMRQHDKTYEVTFKFKDVDDAVQNLDTVLSEDFDYDWKRDWREKLDAPLTKERFTVLHDMRYNADANILREYSDQEIRIGFGRQGLGYGF